MSALNFPIYSGNLSFCGNLIYLLVEMLYVLNRSKILLLIQAFNYMCVMGYHDGNE